MVNTYVRTICILPISFVVFCIMRYPETPAQHRGGGNAYRYGFMLKPQKRSDPGMHRHFPSCCLRTGIICIRLPVASYTIVSGNYALCNPVLDTMDLCVR